MSATNRNLTPDATPALTTTADPLNLTLALFGRYAAAILDEPPSLTRLTEAGMTDVMLESWLTRGLAIATTEAVPDTLPPGWRIKVADQRMVGLATPDSWAWTADADAMLIDLPPEWLACARERGEVIVLVGTLHLATCPDSDVISVVANAIARGRVAGGIVAFEEAS